MAKGKYQYWLTDEGLIRIQGWARDGLTDEQIAQNMGINVATLYRWKDKYCEICEALKENKDVADRQVENALYQSALSGNTTAQIFWLKNRKPDQWRDKHDVDVDTDVSINDAAKRIDEILSEIDVDET